MYKTVLLTDNEITLIRKVIGEYLHQNLIDIQHKDIKNLHIIDRTLKGKKPTLNTVNQAIWVIFPQIKYKSTLNQKEIKAGIYK